MNLLRSSLALLAVCSLFASSLVRADDCSDSLMAESCACRSDVRSERKQLKTAHSKASKSARIKLTAREKTTLASAAAAPRD